MKNLLLSLICFFSAVDLLAQNVGIGTLSPVEKLDVNGNINLSGTLKINGSSGQTGDVLSGTGNNLAWVKGIYTLNASNYLSTSVPSNNYVRIDGNITLSADFNGLNNQKLIITGGSINGNGATILGIGLNSTISGTSFTNVDINANSVTFINCAFSGSMPRAGNNCKYINCQFSGLTLSSASQLGSVQFSSLQNCTIPRTMEFINTELINCSIGNGSINNNSISLLNNCSLLNTYIYAFQSDLTFTGNTCRNSKLLIGNSSQSPNYVTVKNNLFNGLLSGESEVIQVDPSSNYFKLYTISNNDFSLQSNTPRAINVSAGDGNPFANSRMSVQNNTFWNSMTTLNYSSNMRINYSYNTVYQTGNHPASTGNLVVNFSITLF